MSDYADADASASALTSLVTQKDDATLPCVVGLSFLPRVTTANIDLAIKVSAVASSATLSDESVDDVRRPRPPPTPRPDVATADLDTDSLASLARLAQQLSERKPVVRANTERA